MTHLFREPWRYERHLKSVGVRMKGVKWFWWHSSKHGEDSTCKLVANCTTKKAQCYITVFDVAPKLKSQYLSMFLRILIFINVLAFTLGGRKHYIELLWARKKLQYVDVSVALSRCIALHCAPLVDIRQYSGHASLPSGCCKLYMPLIPMSLPKRLRYIYRDVHCLHWFGGSVFTQVMSHIRDRPIFQGMSVILSGLCFTVVTHQADRF